VSDQDRYLPREGVALGARIRSLLGAVKSAKEHAQRANQDAAYSALETVEHELHEALARVIP
jgi:hypothetical protein